MQSEYTKTIMHIIAQSTEKTRTFGKRWKNFGEAESGPQRGVDKSVFGGQGPRPMRHEPWVVNQHPLGPSTDTAQENCFQNPYDAAVGAAISRPKGCDF